ncbi:hypothetical protein CHU92_11120 [Flavobacterium cyanobacteriorum]|uniref:Uncharacterized protein n=1 Tax=Flavobacterium cyanobacteriorum TaxID=2022802 RepID=A0A255Z130_9FLAO|nr:hypothetical protein [Flavobacterium cyanobacteriorum]OYQ35121.1 hypothetical protein CHU92_11120 [Flavobacterium cyanobacteriorum]
MEVNTTNEQSTGFIIKSISFNELKINRKAIQKLDEAKLKRKGALAARGVYNAELGVFIDTSNIVMIEKDGRHSYTFQISKEDTTNKYENLVLNSKEGGGYDAYITEYLLTPEEMDKLSKGGIIASKMPDVIKTIENTARISISGNGADCVDIRFTSVGYCQNASGQVIRDNGDSGNGCVRNWHVVQHMVLVVDLKCMSGGDNGGPSPRPGSPSPGSTGGTPGGGGGLIDIYNPTTPPPAESGGSNPAPQQQVSLSPVKDHPVLTTPVLVNKAETQLVNRLTASQRNWWNNTATQQQKTEITAYLFDNGVSTDALNDVIAFIQSSIDSGLKLDFDASQDSPANVDLSAVSGNSPEEEKFREIYQILREQPLFKELFNDLFDDNLTVNVKFRIDNIATNGQCVPKNLSNGRYYNEITIDREHLLENSNVYIACSIIHECIHAYLLEKIRNSTIGMTVPNLSNNEFATAMNHVYNGQDPEMNQHNFMFNHMAPVIADILADLKDELLTPEEIAKVENPAENNGYYMYAPANPPTGPSTTPITWVWEDYFRYMSLQGLQTCTAFQQDYPINSVAYYYFLSYFTTGEGAFNP